MWLSTALTEEKYDKKKVKRMEKVERYGRDRRRIWAGANAARAGDQGEGKQGGKAKGRSKSV